MSNTTHYTVIRVIIEKILNKYTSTLKLITELASKVNQFPIKWKPRCSQITKQNIYHYLILVSWHTISRYTPIWETIREEQELLSKTWWTTGYYLRDSYGWIYRSVM